MRKETDARKIRKFMKRLAEESRGPGDVFLTGGASAVLLGWRRTTVDVDLELDPEPAGAFAAISRLKDAGNERRAGEPGALHPRPSGLA